jgi:predicted nuclease of predicted toxin-antitoxin system
MRFLVDRCAGRTLAEWLRGLGHDVLEARDLGPDPGDETLLQMAVDQSRITITIDSDFGLLIFRDAASHFGLVRLPDVPAAQRVALMNEVLTRHADDLAAKAVITVRGNRIRVSR